MRKDAKNWLKHVKKGIYLLSVICFLNFSCTAYNPSVFTGYDVLNPNEAVKANPVAFLVFDAELNNYTIKWDADFTANPETAYFVVNESFLQSYQELREEIKKLRKKIQ